MNSPIPTLPELSEAAGWLINAGTDDMQRRLAAMTGTPQDIAVLREAIAYEQAKPAMDRRVSRLRPIEARLSKLSAAGTPKESHLSRIARERREARGALGIVDKHTGGTPPLMAVPLKGGLNREKIRQQRHKRTRTTIVEVEKKPLMLKVGELAFHPHLKRVGLLPDLISRETALGLKDGKSRNDHKAHAEELDREFAALKTSILEHGLREPLKVVKDSKGKWLVVDGRHRYQAVLEIVRDNSPLDARHTHNPTHLANADKLAAEGMTCVEIQPHEVDAVIMDAVKRRHFSKGALAYLAVLMHPKIATEGKERQIRKPAVCPSISGVQKNSPEIEVLTAGARIEHFAKQTGVSLTMLEYAIRLYKIFADREDLRQVFEPAIWIGESLDRILGGVGSYQNGQKDGEESADQREHRIAVDAANHAAQRFMQLEVSMRKWATLLPEGKTMVIEKALRVLAATPEDFRGAILKGLEMLPGAV